MQMQTSDLTVKQILHSYLSCVLAATLTLILHGKIRYPNLPLGLSEGQIHLLLSRTGGWNPHRTVCVSTQNLSLLQLLYNLPSPEKCEVRPTSWSFVYTSCVAPMTEQKTHRHWRHTLGKKVAWWNDRSSTPPTKRLTGKKRTDWFLEHSHSSIRPVCAT